MTQGERSAKSEFEGAKFGDARLASRLCKLGELLSASPSDSLPRALGNEGRLEAGYRFFANRRVTPKAVLAPHREMTAERASGRSVCVVAHDTTEFIFEGERENLGRIRTDTRGFLAHVSLVVTADEERHPLGVLGVETWTRPTERRKRQTPRERQADPTRESRRWWRCIEEAEKHRPTDTRFLHVMDREADAYDLLDNLQSGGFGFVIRFCMDRRLAGEEHGKTLLQANRGRFIVSREVELSRRTGKGKQPRALASHPPRDARLASLSVHARTITLKRPRDMKSAHDELCVQLVTVEEENPPEGETRVSWRLYTSEAIDTEEQVLEIVDAYRARWRIEEYFKALKTGCQIEKRQLGTLDGLLNLLAVFMPIAWQMLALRTSARRNPSRPASDVLSVVQLEVLAKTLEKPLPKEPTVQDVIYAIAGIGGHLKRNGAPGWMTLGAGMEKLGQLVAGYKLAAKM